VQAGNAFECFDTTGSIKNFNAGNNEIWMVNVHNEVYQREGVDHAQTPYGTGFGWNQIPGDMTYVATAEEGIVWGIDVDGEVWRYDGGDISIQVVINNIDHGWTLVEGAKLLEVDVGYNAQVVGSNNQQQAFFRNGITEDTPMGSGWFQFEDQFEHIVMCGNGQIFAISSADQHVYYRTQVDDENLTGSTWVPVDATASDMRYKQLTCGKRGQLLVVSE
jgi:hypothetical protein